MSNTPWSPGSPKSLRGALVSMPVGGTPVAVAFQYNPANVKRTLQPQMVAVDQGDRSDATLFVGAPVETIELVVELDATDPLPAGGSSVADSGLYGPLAALETLLYPTSGQVQQVVSKLSSGTMEVGPFVAPLTLLVWGSRRVVPVQVSRLAVTEQLYDPALNPLRAEVEIALRVLSWSDLTPDAPGYSVFMAYQQSKEALAALAQLQGSAAIQGATGVTGGSF